MFNSKALNPLWSFLICARISSELAMICILNTHPMMLEIWLCSDWTLTDPSEFSKVERLVRGITLLPGARMGAGEAPTRKGRVVATTKKVDHISRVGVQNSPLGTASYRSTMQGSWGEVD